METPLSVQPAFLPPGALVGPWRLLAFVSHGSSGFVFRVEHSAHPDAGLFALKLAREPGDPRFTREVELLSRIHHPHVPRLRDSGLWMSPGGALFPFLVMEWVDGLPLYSWARLHRPSSRQVLRLLAQLARALQATHEAGGLHRDLKGDNIVVRTSDDHALLTDFGSCTYRGAPVLTRQSHPPATNHYWSPQLQLHVWKFRRRSFARYEATAEDDVYALGVTAYRLVTGRYPLIAEDTDTEEDDSFVRFPALVPAEALVHLSPELARWIGQMLAERPEARGSTKELAQGLERAAKTAGREADRPITPRTAPARGEPNAAPIPEYQPLAWKGWLIGATVSALLLLGVGSLLLVSWRDPSVAAARESARAAQAAAQQGETASLGEVSLTEQQAASAPTPPKGGFGVEVPKDPLPGQRLPPCKKPQIELNGSCWIRVADESPPCAESTYEWKKRCYWPAYGPPRPATSEQQ